MKTAPNNYHYGSYEPIDPAWMAEHDKRYVEKTQQLVESIKKEWAGATNEDRYELLQLNCVERGPDLAEHMNGGKAIKSAAVWFDGLTDLAESTDSVYLRRYIDWRKNIEVHNVIGESLHGYVEVDTTSPKYDAARHQQLFDYFDGLTFDEPTDIPHKYTEAGEAFVSALPPKERALYDWGLRMMQEKPATALDSDYYPPSPFTALTLGISGESFKKLPGKELELALETLHVFGLLDIDDISERARDQLYHIGLGLDEQTHSRLARASNSLTYEGRVVFAEAFLATEFGDDLGEQILLITEQDKASVSEVLPVISSVLKNINSFTTNGIMGEISPGLADDIRRGISTRAAEIMYALNQRISKGKDAEKPKQALAKLMEWSEGIADMLQNGLPQKVQQTGNTKLYHFVNLATGEKYPGAVELTSHGKFADNATVRERYVKEGRGARISFTYDKDSPIAALSLNGGARRQAMNGRFDKSVYNINTNTSDPDAENAEVSFDIASRHAPASSLPRIVAEVISEGSAIRDTGDGRKGGAGNYTYDIIDQKHGGREVFAGYVKTLGDILDEKERLSRIKHLASKAVDIVA